MTKARARRCALAIGGLDPGGGAGIAADLRAFTAAGAFGCAAVAVLTVQSTDGLRRVTAVPPTHLLAQVREVVEHQRVAAIKIGALGTVANVRAVGRWLAETRVPVVVDTPMVATRGATNKRARLLSEAAAQAVRTALVPRAYLLTVNAMEAGVLLGRVVEDVADAYDAALALCDLGARATLVKGGHLAESKAIDVLAFDGEVTELRARRVNTPPLHGLGCTLASLIAGRLAADPRSYEEYEKMILMDAVRWAKRAHHAAIEQNIDVGGALRVIAF